MRKGNRVAICEERSSVRTALHEITRAQSGAALVTDSAGTLVGYLTDGDVRRHLLTAPDATQHLLSSIAQWMTRSPLALRPAMPALEALRLLQSRTFNDAPVVDEGSKPVGWLDISELLKAGLA